MVRQRSIKWIICLVVFMFVGTVRAAKLSQTSLADWLPEKLAFLSNYDEINDIDFDESDSDEFELTDDIFGPGDSFYEKQVERMSGLARRLERLLFWLMGYRSQQDDGSNEGKE